MKRIILFFLLFCMIQSVSANQYSIANITDCQGNITISLSSNVHIDTKEYNITPNCEGNTTDNTWICLCGNTNYYLNTQLNTINKYYINIDYLTTHEQSENIVITSGGGRYYTQTPITNKTTTNTTNKTVTPNTTTPINNITNNTPKPVTITQPDTSVTQPSPQKVNNTVNNTTDGGIEPLVLPNLTIPFIIVVLIILFIIILRKMKKKKAKMKKTKINYEEEIQNLYDDFNGVKKIEDVKGSFCVFCNQTTKDIKSYVNKDMRCAKCGNFKKGK